MRFPVPVASLFSARARKSDVPDFASVPWICTLVIVRKQRNPWAYQVGCQFLWGHANTSIRDDDTARLITFWFYKLEGDVQWVRAIPYRLVLE